MRIFEGMAPRPQYSHRVRRRHSSILSRVFVALVAATIAMAGYAAFSDWDRASEPVTYDAMPSGD